MCRSLSGTATVLIISGSRLLSVAGHWSTERTSELWCTCSFHATQVEDGPNWPTKHPAGRTNSWHLGERNESTSSISEETRRDKPHWASTWVSVSSAYPVKMFILGWGRWETFLTVGTFQCCCLNKKQERSTSEWKWCYVISNKLLVLLSKVAWWYLYVSKVMWNSFSGSACPTTCSCLDIVQYFMMENGTEKWFLIWKQATHTMNKKHSWIFRELWDEVWGFRPAVVRALWWPYCPPQRQSAATQTRPPAALGRGCCKDVDLACQWQCWRSRCIQRELWVDQTQWSLLFKLQH